MSDLDPASGAATPRHVPRNPHPADAGELIEKLSHRVSGLPQRTALNALTDLAFHHPALAETCWRRLQNLAASGLVAERALAIEMARVLGHRDPQAAITLASTALEPIPADPGRGSAPDALPESTMLLLASSQLMNLLLQHSWDGYEQITPILSRMISGEISGDPHPSRAELTALAERAVGNAVMIACVAACRHPEALDLIRTLDGTSITRRAATATAMVQMVPVAFAPSGLLDELAALCDDPDDEVARQAGMALYNLPEGNTGLIQRLLPDAASARTFELASGPVVRCLERAGTQEPGLVLQIATRFFDVYGHEAADLRTAAPPDATMLSALTVSTYATHLKDQTVSEQCLDLIDRGILCDTWDIEKHMDLFDR